MQRNFEPMQKQVEGWRESLVTDEAAKLLIYRAFIEGARTVIRLLHLVGAGIPDELERRPAVGHLPNHVRRHDETGDGRRQPWTSRPQHRTMPEQEGGANTSSKPQDAELVQ